MMSPGFDGFAGDDVFALDHADDESGQIVFALGIKAGHLGGLAADQRAAVVLAGFGESLDDFFGDFRVELAGCQVIHEEQRRRALNGNVVDAVVYQVGADGVMNVHFEGQFQFGTDAIHAGDQDGIEVLRFIDRRTARQSRRSRSVRPW